MEAALSMEHLHLQQKSETIYIVSAGGGMWMGNVNGNEINEMKWNEINKKINWIDQFNKKLKNK